MEYLGCRDGVDILGSLICLDQTLIAGHVGENAQLDLGVVGIQEQESVPRDKDLPYLPSKLHADRNVLEVRLRAGDPACRRDRLVKAAVDPAILFDICSQTVRVGGI